MNHPITTKQLVLTRRSPAYWRATFNHPPLNIFGPDTIPQLNEIITALETDERVKVIVFDSAIEGFFPDSLRFPGEDRGHNEPAARTHRVAAVAGHVGAPEPCTGRFDRVN